MIRPDRPRDRSVRAAVAMFGLGALVWTIAVLSLV